MLTVSMKIPTTAEIIKEAKSRLNAKDPDMLLPQHVRIKFSDVVETIFEMTYKIYLEHEKRVINTTIKESIDSMKKEMFTKDEVRVIADDITKKSIKLEKSFKQSRASRAGKSFEILVHDLLKDLGIKSEHVTRGDNRAKLRRIDLVIPDRKTAMETPDKAHFLSLKTSLRERWKQVVQEQTQGQRTHLITLLQKEIISNAVAQNITEHGIFLYVPDRVKDDRFSDNRRIRRLSDLPSCLT